MTTPPSQDEIVLLARHAGLDLPDEFLADLIAAYGNVRQMIARIPKARPRGDEPAHVFTSTKFLPCQTEAGK